MWVLHINIFLPYNHRVVYFSALVMLVSPHEHVLSMGGSNATFDCVISGHPISSITWARDFEDLNLVDVRLYMHAAKTFGFL